MRPGDLSPGPFVRFLCAALISLAVLAMPGGAAETERMVVLISVDGLASYYLDDPMADIPTIQRLAREGASAKRMNMSFPSVTWTSHTTLATGVYPRKHGLIANSILNRETLESVRYVGDAVYTKDEAVKAQTIYDAAYEAGLKTAAVIWPAVRGAKTLHWLTPDVGTEDLILRDTTSELNRDLGEPIGNPIAAFSKWRWGTAPGPLRDGKYSELAAYLMIEKKPNLLLVHLVNPDSYQHSYGPQTPEAYWSINYIDYRLRYIIEKLQAAGLDERTTLFLVSDHGFVTINQNILPNVLLKKENLAEFDGSSPRLGSKAYVIAHGGSASVYILEPERKQAIAKQLKKLFSNIEGIQDILDADDFHRLGLPTPEENPEQGDLMLIPEDHYAFSGKVDGDEWILRDLHSGTHGHLPSHPRMGAMFVAWGSGIKKGVKLDSVNAVDVTPTIAEVLGIEMDDTDGRVLKEILE